MIIRGVLPGMDLSAGKAIDATTWWVSASDLDYAWIAPPPSFAGSADLIAELRLHNGKIADQQTIHLKWLLAISQDPANPPLDQQENLQADRQKTQTSSSIAPKRPEQARPLKELQSSSLPGQGGLKEGSTDAMATSSVRTLQGAAPSDGAAPPVPASKVFPQANTGKSARTQHRPKQGRGDQTDGLTDRRDNPRAPSDPVNTREGTRAFKGFWDWSR